MPAANPREPSSPDRATQPADRPDMAGRVPVTYSAGDAHARVRHRVRRLTLDAVLIALALVLSIVERWIPLDLIVPIPGIKLGLANIVSLFALLRMTPLDAVAILVARSLIMGLITGPTTLFFSLGGGVVALLLMWLLSRWEGRAFSLVGISIAGAAGHNFGQSLVAVALLGEPLLLQVYLPPLLLTSIVTGALTGIGAYPVVARFPVIRPVPRKSVSASARGRRGSAQARMLLAGGLALGLLLQVLPLSGCKVLNEESQATGSQATGSQTTPQLTTQTVPPSGSSAATAAPSGSVSGPSASNTSPTSAATGPGAPSDGIKYTHEFSGVFGTVIQFIGYASDKPAFDAQAKAGEQLFRELNQLFDAYHDYPGIANIKTINDRAGQSPVTVDPRIIALLLNVRQWRATLSPLVDITIGPVVALWAEYREIARADAERGAPPPQDRLAEALLLTGADDLVIDPAAGTVFLKRAGMKLDVGAVAKGYATELVAQALAAQGARSMIINAGGSSVRLIGKPEAPQRSTWNIAIQNPEYLLASQDYAGGDPAQTLTVVHATGTSVVTSGDYQRYYQVEDQIYHHIVHPQTGQPTHHYRAVTVVVQDSGLADFLSTALFLMAPEESRDLVERLPGVEALWVYPDGRVDFSSGMGAIADPVPTAGSGQPSQTTGSGQPSEPSANPSASQGG